MESNQHQQVAPSVATRPEAYALRALRYFNGYRIGVPLAIGLLYLSPYKPDFLGATNQVLFAWTLSSYLLSNIFAEFLIRFTRQPFSALVLSLGSLDVFAITLMMYASGGVSSGLGMLLAVSAASVSLLLANRTGLLIAAMSSLAILGEQLFRQLSFGESAENYVQASILGTTYFLTSILSLFLAQRAAESEHRANRDAHALERLQRLNERVIQYMKTGMLVVDDRGIIELNNQSAWKLLGMPEQIRGCRLHNISRPLTHELQQWSRHRGYRTTPFRASTNGPLLSSSFQRFSDDSRTTLIFLEDRSRITQTAQHMKLSSLGRLTASIAHEIRNPLGALSHASQLLAESESLTAEDRQMLEIILNHSERMNMIIENIMNLSQRKEAHSQAIQLSLLLKHFVEDFSISRKPKPIVEVEITQLKIRVPFDISQFTQILTNLCENAARFSAEKSGKPWVRIVVGEKFGRRRAFLDVIDRGQGVPPNQVEQIFEPFFTTSPKGSGLGLYLARELCEANGARLEYVPIPKGGACFRIHFAELSES